MKRREPMTFYEALEPLSDLWQHFIWWLMDALIQPVDLLTAVTAWLAGHLRVLLVVSVVVALFDALAYVQPLWAAAAFVGACVGVVIAVFVSLTLESEGETMNRREAEMLAAELEGNRWMRVGCVMTYPDGSGVSFVTVQSRRNPEDIRHIHSPRHALGIARAMQYAPSPDADEAK
jgi:hypothetical protein